MSICPFDTCLGRYLHNADTAPPLRGAQGDNPGSVGLASTPGRIVSKDLEHCSYTTSGIHVYSSAFAVFDDRVLCKHIVSHTGNRIAP